VPLAPTLGRGRFLLQSPLQGGRVRRTPCEFKVGDKVGMPRGDGSLDPLYTGTVEKVQFNGPPDGGYYDCHYVARRPDGSSFIAPEIKLKKATT
jgi:hypothetical protein